MEDFLVLNVPCWLVVSSTVSCRSGVVLVFCWHGVTVLVVLVFLFFVLVLVGVVFLLVLVSLGFFGMGWCDSSTRSTIFLYLFCGILVPFLSVLDFFDDFFDIFVGCFEETECGLVLLCVVDSVVFVFVIFCSLAVGFLDCEFICGGWRMKEELEVEVVLLLDSCDSEERVDWIEESSVLFVLLMVGIWDELVVVASCCVETSSIASPSPFTSRRRLRNKSLCVSLLVLS